MEILDQPLDSFNEDRFDFDVPPTAGAAFRHALTVLGDKFFKLLAVLLIVLALDFVASNMSLFSVVISLTMWYGFSAVALKAIRGEEFDIIDVFAGFNRFGDVLLSGVLFSALVVAGGALVTVLAIFAGAQITWAIFTSGILFTDSGITVILLTILLVVLLPGILIGVKFVFVPYLVMDKKMDAIAALKGSWEMTSGFVVQIFLLELLSIFVVLGGILLLGIGMFPAFLWVGLAMATLYQSVDSYKNGNIVREEDLVD